jgi:hypothetical protein
VVFRIFDASVDSDWRGKVQVKFRFEMFAACA